MDGNSLFLKRLDQVKRIITVPVIFSFFFSFITPPRYAYSQTIAPTAMELPAPGTMLSASGAFSPALFRGLIVHPEDPLRFDFIVDPGDEKLSGDALAAESQRMINYFLASLAVPQKDLWVNLSPVEKDRIVPDALIKTELGRDLLAEDYMLKQVTASLIYPEGGLGMLFWKKVYDEAYRKFGVTDIPVDTFNKVWIVPERASVFETRNAAYITRTHLKVMLEQDYLAQQQGRGPGSVEGQDGADSSRELSRNILRAIVLPALEKEVNEGRNFVRLRQVVYAMVLAQWYQDVLKESVLNRAYAGRNKVAGIDLSDPASKEKIYQQYLAAYKKGVFNYIKEETDRLTKEPVPRKYFSGGVDGTRRIVREHASGVLTTGRNASVLVRAKIEDAAQAVGNAVMSSANVVRESYAVWNDPGRALPILKELSELRTNGGYEPERVRGFIERYAPQVEEQAKQFPVQSAWPILKAVVLLGPALEAELVNALVRAYDGKECPVLVDKIRMMHEGVYEKDWVTKNTPDIQGRVKYNFFAEMFPAEGGLGEVAENEVDGEISLGMRTVGIQPWYSVRPNEEKIDYTVLGLKNFNEDFLRYDLDVGDADGESVHVVRVQVARAEDEYGVPIYFFRDIAKDGKLYKGGIPYYTKMLYNYGLTYNPVTKEESMAFLNRAAAKLVWILERRRAAQEEDAWKPSLIHANDGQYGPLFTVLMSMFGQDPVIQEVIPAETTHTIFNTGRNDQDWGIRVFLKHMLGISPAFINLYRHESTSDKYIDHTTGGLHASVNQGGLALGVANTHAIDMSKLHRLTIMAMTNGAKPEKLAKEFNRAFRDLQKQGVIAADADYNWPTPDQDRLTKIGMKKRLNSLGVKTAAGRTVTVDPNAILFGDFIRNVWEKVSFDRAWIRDNIMKTVQAGGYIVRVNRYQGPQQSDRFVRFYQALEVDIANLKKQQPDKFPGDFFYVIDAKPEVKPYVLGSFDGVWQDPEGPNDLVIDGVTLKNTEAAGYSEAYPVGAYVVTGKAGVGVIKDQGVGMKTVAHVQNGRTVWSFEHPGEGNTVTPQEDTDSAWWDTAISPLIDLWKTDRLAFYTGASKTAWLIRIMSATITAADNLRAFNVAARLFKDQKEHDQQVRQEVIGSSQTDPGAAYGVVVTGRKAAAPVFHVLGQVEEFPAASAGLRDVIQKIRALEAAYGYDALQYYFDRGDQGRDPSLFEKYVSRLFNGLTAGQTLKEALDDIQKGPGSPVRKSRRMIGLLESILFVWEGQSRNIVMSPRDAGYLLDGIKGDFVWRKDAGEEGIVDRNGGGLRAFVKEFERMEARYDVWQYHHDGVDMINYLQFMLNQSPMFAPLREKLKDRILRMQMPGEDRRALVRGIFAVLKEEVAALAALEKKTDWTAPVENMDAAQDASGKEQVVQGGIDVRNISVDRQGGFASTVVSDQALEDRLVNAPGLQGIITDIKPVSDLGALLGLAH